MTSPAPGIGVRSLPRWAASILVLALACLPAFPGIAQSASPAAGRHAVIASGPFGSVPGQAVLQDQPLPDPAGLEALDAYGRGASVTFAPATGSFESWQVTTLQEPILDAAAATELASGSSSDRAVVRLPTTGLFLVRLGATIVDPESTGSTGTSGSWVWRIAVPDRDVPGDGDPYPPVPAIVLTSGDQSVVLDQGSGCFVGTCGDIGATAPPRTLPTIRTVPGTPLTVRLTDASGMVGWTVDATPVDSAEGDTLSLYTATSQPAVDSLTFVAPTEGRWVILVRVVFERDRGSFDGYGRLVLTP
ncbi:MAG: hypothetical protein LH650_02910 [Chloroflexi bacterium]|nr:hypothetical protein [Chloroflexota bacterium]